MSKAGPRLLEHREKLIHIDVGYVTHYSFPEFLPARYDGSHGDIRRDYNPAYFDCSFSYNEQKDQVTKYYQSVKGVLFFLEFDDFFERCKEDTKEYILFNLDFFRPTH